MDPQGTAMMSDGVGAGGGGGVYNLAEIWPGFANATSFGGLALDPMLLDQRSTHHHHLLHSNSRKRREDDNNHNNNDDDEAAASAGGARASSSNDNNTHNTNAMSESDNSKRQKAALSNENSENKPQGEGNSGKAPEQSAKPAEHPKQDYIHVRARRGQATDSHSLAERARREKISERMKILQDLVPGCNKVIGKALVLDEIINYIQSLQRQVEFLSLKLEAVNARGIEGYPSKDFAQQTFDAPGMPQFGSQGTREYGRGSSPEWLHMQLGGGFERPS